MKKEKKKEEKMTPQNYNFFAEGSTEMLTKVDNKDNTKKYTY